jgi:GAF domain-containing protein
VLITDPRPLRLPDVSAHPRSYGFPLNHPPMTTFLGVPIVIDGEAWGNLYLAETTHGEFTADDEDAAVVLAGWAAIAVTNARLYRDVRAAEIALLEGDEFVIAAVAGEGVIGETVEVLLRDDGRGFAPRLSTTGFGLVGMHERVALVRGALVVESRPGEGTTLRARIPSSPPQS